MKRAPVNISAASWHASCSSRMSPISRRSSSTGWGAGDGRKTVQADAACAAGCPARADSHGATAVMTVLARKQGAALVIRDRTLGIFTDKGFTPVDFKVELAMKLATRLKYTPVL